jgi:hypothetical protein
LHKTLRHPQSSPVAANLKRLRTRESDLMMVKALKSATDIRPWSCRYNPTWLEIALRLVLTLIAGAIIGFNREANGHFAGLKTTSLVGLAASVAMVQANILLRVAGKTAGSFAVMDLMRLPWGF